MILLTKQEAKEFLRVDFEDDDQLIELLIMNAESYLRDAIDNFDAKISVDIEGRFKSKSKLVMLVLITNWYDNRDFTDLKVDEKTRYTISSLMQQMKYGYGDFYEQDY